MRLERPFTRLATPRARRLAFVLTLAPGPILLVAAVNLWANPWLLALGLTWIVVVVWRLRGLVAGRGPSTPASPSPQPPELEP